MIDVGIRDPGRRANNPIKDSDRLPSHLYKLIFGPWIKGSAVKRYFALLLEKIHLWTTTRESPVTSDTTFTNGHPAQLLSSHPINLTKR